MSLPAPTPDAFAAALAEHPARELPARPGRTNHLPAGVLVPLRWDPARGPVAVFTLRAAGLRQHAGQVSFPGGKPEPEDADLEATALREAREELGIAAPRVLGRLSSMPVYTSDHRLVPFVAEADAAPLAPDPGEVERPLTLPLAEALAAPRIEAIPYEWAGRALVSPVFRPAGWGCVLFGATAHTFLELLEVAAPLFGLPVPPLEPGELGWADVLG